MTSYSANCLFPLKRMSSPIPNIHVLTDKKKFHVPCYRLLASCKIPFPVTISCVFLNHVPYFGHIPDSPDPENTLPDTDHSYS